MTLADILFYDLPRLVDNEIRKPLLRLRDAMGGDREVAKAIRWSRSHVEYYLALEPLNALPGDVLFELTEAHLRSKSRPKLVVMVKRSAVLAMKDALDERTAHMAVKGRPDPGSKRSVAKVLHMDDSYMGGLIGPWSTPRAHLQGDGAG